MLNRVPTRSTFLGLLVVVLSVCLTAVALELMLRIYHGKLLDVESITHGRTVNPIADYDPRLGWVPSAGRFGRPGWSWSVDETGLRHNGRPATLGGRCIVTVGDSFTFGDEVDDADTWPAQLEAILHERVLNAGVFAYGVDQAYLRAEKLLPVHEPRVVVLAFISNDIDRTELSYYHRRWKPYFEYGSGGLQLRNVPVPEGRVASQPFSGLNRAVGYSYLANAVLMRTPLGAWYAGPDRLRNHRDGERVTIELLSRLTRLGSDRNARVVALTFATDGRIGGNERLRRVVERLRENRVEVLDLASEMLQMPRERFLQMFSAKGHYGPDMNRWVASRLAEFLRAGAPAPRVRAERARR